MEHKTALLPGSRPAQPWAAPPYDPKIVFSSENSSASAKGPAQHGRILIVEDEFLVACQIENALVEAGFEVAGIAVSGEEALDLAAAERPALAIMDIRLSGPQDGIDTALQLFAQHGIRCVFATAHYTAEAQVRASPANPLAWVPKPYTMTYLVEAVRRIFRNLQDEKQ